MPTLVLLWVWFCAYLNCAGWTLSALHQLNARGYAIALMLWFAGLTIWWKKNSASFSSLPSRDNFCLRKFLRRFRKPFPLAFLILAVMAFLGGALYAPSNYDALAYRIPRVLHWLAADQWQWIHTDFPRLNQRCCGIEWVSAPVIALLKTDRPLFLINFISFLFLPGLVFSVFTRLGVRARVAWHWMWLVPTGYCYLLQAASLGTDLFGAVFVLAALDFALRAKISGSARDFFAAMLAAALMTGAKPSNLPLLLPWAIAILPSLKLFLRWPLRTAAVDVIALAASYAPTAVLNVHYCGDWTGIKVEMGIVTPAPFFLTGVNSFLIGIQNFDPPVFPFNGWWHNFFAGHLPSALAMRLDQTMELGLRTFDLDILQIEEHAGLGFGICVLLLTSLFAVRFARPETPRWHPSLWLQAVRWTPMVGFLILLSQSRYVAFSREITPYYAVLLPLFLAQSGQAWLVNQCWWRRCAMLVFIFAAGLLILSPARPLFPVQSLINSPSAPAHARAVYSVYQNRNDAFAPVRAKLPADLKILGLLTYDDPETSLWRPFGSRQIMHFSYDDSPSDLRARGVKFALVSEFVLEQHSQMKPPDWLARMNAEPLQHFDLKLRAGQEAHGWLLVRFR